MTMMIGSSGDNVEQDVLAMVAANVDFPKGHFPEYKIGPKNSVICVEQEDENHDSVPLKEVIVKETLELNEQHQRLSVHDLRAKFEKSLIDASKLIEEAKQRESASLGRQVLLKKLRDKMDTLRAHVTGISREDTEEAISLVEALAVQLTQREGELLYEKAEVKKRMDILKQATEDGRRLVEHERSNALAEVDKAKAQIKRIENQMKEHEQSTSSSKEKEEIEELRKMVGEARRIRMLHQPNKVKDMECETVALRGIIKEKTQLCDKLKRQLSRIKRLEDAQNEPYKLEGSEILGCQLCIVPLVDTAADVSTLTIQWYHVMSNGSKKEIILGATKTTYAPEPSDVGRYLLAEIDQNNEKVPIQTAGPIKPDTGLERFVDALRKKPDTEFNVTVTQMNGKECMSSSMHVFHVGKQRLKLCKGRFTKARETFSSSMQFCGARGAGAAAAKEVFWRPKKGQSFILRFESNRERNAAIMLARSFASDCKVVLAGPGDLSPAGS